MKSCHGKLSSLTATLTTLFVMAVLASPASAGGKMGVYGLRMVPDGDDAKDYSNPGWGAGIHAVFPLKQVWNLFAIDTGFEFVNLLSETIEFQQSITQLRVEQRTNQTYYRLYLGGQVGGHGNGFIRPHAGINLALVIYDISTNVVIPDDDNDPNDITQSLYQNTEAVFGSDITLGVDLNFSNTIALDGGVRYLKSFAVPQDLGGKSVKVHPQYFQVYLGIGMAFEWIAKLGKDESGKTGESGK